MAIDNDDTFRHQLERVGAIDPTSTRGQTLMDQLNRMVDLMQQQSGQVKVATVWLMLKPVERHLSAITPLYSNNPSRQRPNSARSTHR
jgi:hypothetical protein